MVNSHCKRRGTLCQQRECDYCLLMNEPCPDFDLIAEPLDEQSRAALNRQIVKAGYGNEELERIFQTDSRKLSTHITYGDLPQLSLYELNQHRKSELPITGQPISISFD